TLLYSFFKNPQLLWVQFNAPFFQKKIGKSIKKLLTNTLARFVEPSISHPPRKEHPYMSELSLFPAYAAIAPNAAIQGDDQVRTKQT
ncbi:hypothetical protein, partial [Faecalibacterium prausnitzii]|uniref:hypothetical protein n=1 Tax=Faecalibacterium prausnitzii TaxID=853 RepID=UPI002907BD1A